MLCQMRVLPKTKKNLLAKELSVIIGIANQNEFHHLHNDLSQNAIISPKYIMLLPSSRSILSSEEDT